MNILIVDDDSYVIEALLKGMEWKNLGIENVYTAYNVKNAKKILESIPMQVMLCDIEMPKENGLSLLRWVREQNLIIQTIFLTSYEEFDYASQAIELQAFSYALKPISYDKLSEVIVKAVEKEKQALKAIDYRKAYEFWIDTEKNRKDTFWQKLLLEKTLVTMTDITKHMKEMDLSYQLDDSFICFTVELFHYKKILENYGNGMLGWTFNNIVEEISQKENAQIEGIIRKEKALWVLILHVNNEVSVENMKTIADKLIQKITKQFQCPASCGIGNVCILGQLADNLYHIKKMCEDNVIRENQVLLLSEYEYKNIVYMPPNFSIWESLVSDGKEEVLLKVINEYLDGLVNKRKVNKEILYQFMMDFIQMIFATLKEKHIMLHGWQYEQFNGELSAEATASVDNMREYLGNIIKGVIRSLIVNGESKSVVDIIKEYIEDNIDKEMTRESLSELVYLNPDYLARLFKKEVGESLGSYITTKRIYLAKEYFETTSDPINVVALKVGYDNFSYFSKVFKDIMGVTPKDYKNNLDNNMK